jgi:hypothetical protein
MILKQMSVRPRAGARPAALARLAVLCLAACCFGHSARAVEIARQDFDSNNDALPGSFNPALDNLDGGPGDFWGVGSRNAWPQGFPAPGVPFSAADDSVFGYSNGGAPFPGDLEGIFGQNANLDNDYFLMSDSDEFLAGQTATWSFNVSGYSGLDVAIDIGSDIDAAFAYGANTFVRFTASIDAGPSQTLFEFTPDVNGLAPGSMRPMDSGGNADPTHLLYASGDGVITKLFAEGGTSTLAGDLYLDKSLAANGALDTFVTTVAGTGNILTLTLTADFPFEAAAFDNIVITAVPEPSSLALVGLAGVATVLFRFRRNLKPTVGGR